MKGRVRLATDRSSGPMREQPWFGRNIRERQFEPGDLEDVRRGHEPYTDPESGLYCIEDSMGNVLVIGDTSGGNVLHTIPSAAAAINVTYHVKRTTGGANTLKVTSSSGNIDGTATVTIATQYTCLQLRSDGADWWIV